MFRGIDFEDLDNIGDMRSTLRAPRLKVHVSPHPLSEKLVEIPARKDLIKVPDEIDMSLPELLGDEHELLEQVSSDVIAAKKVLKLIEAAGEDGLTVRGLSQAVSGENVDVCTAVDELEGLGFVVRFQTRSSAPELGGGAWLVERSAAEKFCLRAESKEGMNKEST